MSCVPALDTRSAALNALVKSFGSLAALNVAPARAGSCHDDSRPNGAMVVSISCRVQLGRSPMGRPSGTPAGLVARIANPITYPAAGAAFGRRRQ